MHTSHTYTRVRVAQLGREETVHKKTASVLSERVKELEQVRSTLGATEAQQIEDKKAAQLELAQQIEDKKAAQLELADVTKALEDKSAELKTAVAEKDVLSDEILTERAEMKKAGELISGLEKELEIERALLGDAQKTKAQARWNLGAGKEKADAFNRKLKFQGGLRQQMVAKTVEERESLIEELVRERKEKEALARQRLETVEQLKVSLNAQIDAVLGNLTVEMGEAEQAATRKESVEITKIAVGNKKSSTAVPGSPKKSGSILGAIGGLFGVEITKIAAAEPEPEPSTTAADDEAASEAAITAAVESMVSAAVGSAAAEASK